MIGLSSTLLLVFLVFVLRAFCVLHGIDYIYESLLIYVFSYDFILVFIAKMFLLSSVILRATHPVTLVKNREWVTKRGCSTMG